MNVLNTNRMYTNCWLTLFKVTLFFKVDQYAKFGRLMLKGQKHINLMTYHAARIHLPKEIFISFERLSLRELTVQILLDFEIYRMLKNDAVSGVPSVK